MLLQIVSDNDQCKPVSKEDLMNMHKLTFSKSFS